MSGKTPVKLSSAQRTGLVLCGIFIAAGLLLMALSPGRHSPAAPVVPAAFPDTTAAAANPAPEKAKTNHKSKTPRTQSAPEPPRNFLEDDF